METNAGPAGNVNQSPSPSPFSCFSSLSTTHRRPRAPSFPRRRQRCRRLGARPLRQPTVARLSLFSSLVLLQSPPLSRVFFFSSFSDRLPLVSWPRRQVHRRSVCGVQVPVSRTVGVQQRKAQPPSRSIFGLFLPALSLSFNSRPSLPIDSSNSSASSRPAKQRSAYVARRHGATIILPEALASPVGLPGPLRFLGRRVGPEKPPDDHVSDEYGRRRKDDDEQRG